MKSIILHSMSIVIAVIIFSIVFIGGYALHRIPETSYSEVSANVISTTNDKVGVAFHIEGTRFLEDLNLNQAELAFFKDRTHLPLVIQMRDWPYSTLRIRIGSRIVLKRSIPDSVIKRFF